MSAPEAMPVTIEEPRPRVVGAKKPGAVIQLRPRDPNAGLVEWTEERRRVLRDVLAKNLSDAQFELYIMVCRHTRLDPFKKQIYAIIREGELTFQTGIGGYRAIANRTGEYDGPSDPEWCGPDGKWRPEWLAKEPPAAARVYAFRKGFRKPILGFARYDAYVALTKQGLPAMRWAKDPTGQLAKCAEALAIRRGFDEEVGAVRTIEEMAHLDNPEPRAYIDATTGEVTDGPGEAAAAAPKATPEARITSLLARVERSETLEELRAAVDDLNAFKPELTREIAPLFRIAGVAAGAKKAALSPKEPPAGEAGGPP